MSFDYQFYLLRKNVNKLQVSQKWRLDWNLNTNKNQDYIETWVPTKMKIILKLEYQQF